MSDDYLWDRSGQADPDLARLEQLLGTLGHRAPMLDLPSVVPPLPASRVWFARIALPLTLAATIVLLVGSTWASLRTRPAGWTVERIQGASSTDTPRPPSHARVGINDWLETDARTTARLRADQVGLIEIGPGSRVRLLVTRDGEHRLALARGILKAQIWAPPGQFYVDTPSATAIDLGCSYTLEVDAKGAAVLHVTSGWVGLEAKGLRSLVPSGAVCETRPGQGPATPHFEDAGAVFSSALADLEKGPVKARERALDTLLHEARRRDALTLWHLLARVDRSSVERVYDRLVALAPPPPSVRREAVLDGDRAALDAWWNALGLGEMTWFRIWKARE